ncbi:MAG: hypothetical protein EXR58_02940 [Chloroflexi bacterium]|nr:hypothetical protein [Chloroflexota bacterium]
MPASDSFAEILDQSLEEIRSGTATLDEVMTRHPELRGELAPLLDLATHITRFEVVPDPARRLAARQAFIEKLHEIPAEIAWRHWLGRLLAPARRHWLGRLLAPALSLRLGAPGLASVLVAVALVTSSGAVYASEQALPGEPFYGVKLAVEQVRLATARDEQSRFEVRLDIAEHRLAEIDRSAATNNEAALQAAAQSYADVMAEASNSLPVLPDNTAGRVIERLQSNLQQQQQVLARIAENAPPNARDSVVMAQAVAQKGLGRANASSNAPTNPTPRTSSPTDSKGSGGGDSGGTDPLESSRRSVTPSTTSRPATGPAADLRATPTTGERASWDAGGATTTTTPAGTPPTRAVATPSATTSSTVTPIPGFGEEATSVPLTTATALPSRTSQTPTATREPSIPTAAATLSPTATVRGGNGRDPDDATSTPSSTPIRRATVVGTGDGEDDTPTPTPALPPTIQATTTTATRIATATDQPDGHSRDASPTSTVVSPVSPTVTPTARGRGRDGEDPTRSPSPSASATPLLTRTITPTQTGHR